MENVIGNINNVLNKFYNSIEIQGYDILDLISDIKVDIFSTEPLSTIYSTDFNKYIMLVINTIIFGYILHYFLKTVLSLYSEKYTVGIYMFIIKVIIITIVARNSYNICKNVVYINGMFTDVIDEFLEEISKEKIDYNFLKREPETLNEFFKLDDKLTITGIGEIIICTFIVNLILVLALRYVIVLLCIILSPFCIVAYLSDETKILFKVWIKTFIINLVVQNINKFVMFIPIVSKKEEKLASIILLGSILLIYKINKSIEKCDGIWKE